ncbi:hypothetical protein [Coleofasciculus sp. FACHB-129]|uniref:hypothetical protein n=1 Tax=Cyanophyceae TaxID=3028117 RepID=UPI001686A319|nr:hypothetical protein [Coleofasciculus sp. FACHB-129]MBD1893098.1 hypothetical protein [Coleofasciculus sp. FACHB-129]
MRDPLDVLFGELKTDVDTDTSPASVHQEYNQSISFTFTGSPTPVNIQYAELIYTEYGSKEVRRTGCFLYGEQPFKLFQTSKSSWHNNSGTGRPEEIPLQIVESLPCTALISQIKQSEFQLNLVQKEPDIWSHKIEVSVSGDAYISYFISYQFNLKELSCTCLRSTDVDVST